MSEPAPTLTRPLEEVMLAMDVVDTLRHRENLVARELSEEDRDAKLIERLREIYGAQGIDVTDAILAEGVTALKEQRFTYKPPPSSLSVTLAGLYVRRHAWGKAALAIVGAVLIAWGAWHWLVTAPGQRQAEARLYDLTEALPKRLDALRTSIESGAKAPEALETAGSIYADGEKALAAEDVDKARAAVAGLQALQDRLDQEYRLRIVSRPGADSGVWRVPDDNPDARNYYLVVEALDRDDRPVPVTVTNEENGEPETVIEWAIRVPVETFNDVRTDKQNDGIIQNDIVGVKRRGALDPDYAMPVSGGAITSW